MYKDTGEAISRIVEGCKICKMNAENPRLFQLTVCASYIQFNHTIQVDTMFIGGKPLLHMFDVATHFCSASFSLSQSMGEIWRSIQQLLSLVYLCPPDYLNLDHGSNY